jgi:hypothetical protein
VSDSNLKILNCVARYPGSTHDSYIWSNSEVYREMRHVWESGERCWLLGSYDSYKFFKSYSNVYINTKKLKVSACED